MTLILYSIPDSVNMRQRSIEWECMGWINVAQRTVLLWTPVSRFIKVCVSKHAESSLTS